MTVAGGTARCAGGACLKHACLASWIPEKRTEGDASALLCRVLPAPVPFPEAVVCLGCFGWGGTSRLTKIVFWMIVIGGIADTALIYASLGWPWAILTAVLAAVFLFGFSHAVELDCQKAGSRWVCIHTAAGALLLIGHYQAALPLICHGHQCLGLSIIIVPDVCDATACLALPRRAAQAGKV